MLNKIFVPILTLFFCTSCYIKSYWYEKLNREFFEIFVGFFCAVNFKKWDWQVIISITSNILYRMHHGIEYITNKYDSTVGEIQTVYNFFLRDENVLLISKCSDRSLYNVYLRIFWLPNFQFLILQSVFSPISFKLLDFYCLIDNKANLKF